MTLSLQHPFYLTVGVELGNSESAASVLICAAKVIPKYLSPLKVALSSSSSDLSCLSK